jgi:hypothetical protein
MERDEKDGFLESSRECIPSTVVEGKSKWKNDSLESSREFTAF